MGNASTVIVARAKRLQDEANRRKAPPRVAEIIPPGALQIEDGPSGNLGRTVAGAPIQRAVWRSARDVRVVAAVFLQEVLDAQEFLAEAAVLCTLAHPNLQDTLGYFVERPRFGLALEYLPLGTLAAYLWDSGHVPRVKLHWHSITKIAIDVTAGLTFLHGEGLRHGNLHARSVLVKMAHNNEYAVKLGDFPGGPRAPLPTSSTSAQFIQGLPSHHAPEYITVDLELHTTKVDSFAMGTLLYELATGRAPELVGYATPWAATQALLQGARPPVPQGLPAFLHDLITTCWDGSPDARPDAPTILRQLERGYPLAMLHDLYSPQETFEHAVLRVFDASGTAAWANLRHAISLQMPRVTTADLQFVCTALGSPGDKGRVTLEAFRAFLATSLGLQLDELHIDAARLSGVRTSMLLKERTISAWSTADVAKWLAGSDLAVYAPLFREHEMDGIALLQLSSDYLRQMGVAQLGPRKRLLRRIQELVAPRPPRPPPASVRRPTNNYAAQTFDARPPDPSPSAALAALSLASSSNSSFSLPNKMAAAAKVGGSMLVRPTAVTIGPQRPNVHIMPNPLSLSGSAIASSSSSHSFAPAAAAAPPTGALQLLPTPSPPPSANHSHAASPPLSLSLTTPPATLSSPTTSPHSPTSASASAASLVSPRAMANAPTSPGRSLVGARLLTPDKTVRIVPVDDHTTGASLAAQLRREMPGATYALFEARNVIDERRVADDEPLAPLVRQWTGNAPRFVWRDASAAQPPVVKETVRVRLVDGTTRPVNVDSASRARDVCSALAARLEREEQIRAGEGPQYRLWERDAAGHARALLPEDNVLLVKAAWDQRGVQGQLVFSKNG